MAGQQRLVFTPWRLLSNRGETDKKILSQSNRNGCLRRESKFETEPERVTKT
jgi:hypothetical protein